MRIRIISQEVRTSATIIAVLPAFVMLGLFVLNHDYVALLFRHPLGQAVLIGAALWMAFGAWMMKRLTVIDV
jgi:tight adherence protein B